LAFLEGSKFEFPLTSLEKEEWGDLKTFIHIFIKTISTCSLLEDNGID